MQLFEVFSNFCKLFSIWKLARLIAGNQICSMAHALLVFHASFAASNTSWTSMALKELCVRRTFIVSLRLCKSRVAPKLLILEIVSRLPSERSLNNADDVKWMKAREQISSNEKQTLWASQTTPWHSEGQSSKKAFSRTTLGISVSSLFPSPFFPADKGKYFVFISLKAKFRFLQKTERCRKKETKKSFVKNIFHCWNVLCRHLHLRDEERGKESRAEKTKLEWSYDISFLCSVSANNVEQQRTEIKVQSMLEHCFQ